MLALFFQSAGVREEFLLCRPVRRQHIRYSRLAARDRSRLVKRDDLCFSGLLERDCRLKHDPVLCSHPVSDHDRDRRCKSERTRTAYNKYGDPSCEGEPGRLPGDQPYEHRHKSDGDHSGHKYA